MRNVNTFNHEAILASRAGLKEKTSYIFLAMPRRGIKLSARECALLLCLGAPPLLNLGCKVCFETC